MKTIYTLFFFFLYGTTLAQQSKIPQEVRQQLSLSFAQATDIRWNSLNQEKYEAKFSDAGVKKTALFSPTGQLLQLLFPVPANALPEEVTNSISQNFAGFGIMNALRLEMGKEVSFRVRLKKGSEGWEIEFDIYGKVTKKVKLPGGGQKSEKEYECEDDDDHKHDGEYCERHQKRHKHNHKAKEKHKHKHKK